MAALPDRLYFRIGEAARIAGVEPSVLRYWEREFRIIHPRKTAGGHRHYSRRDVELFLLIKRLLHEERFTIEGARRRLHRMRRDLVAADAPDPQKDLAADLRAIRADLVAILALIDEPDGR